MKTDRIKHPKCKHCNRTLVWRGGFWRHRKSGDIACKPPKVLLRVAEPA